MDYKTINYPEAKFGGFTDIDGTIVFYTRIHALLEPTSVVLDIGCGRGAHAADTVLFRKEIQIVKGKCQKVIGIDIDESAQENPFIDEFHQISGPRWPLADKSIDLAVCDSVLEHIEDPDLFFSECSRVIRPGGMLCLRTGNLFGYVCLLSKIIPNRLHTHILDRFLRIRGEKDVFPTCYKCNTIGRIRKMLTKYDFEHCVYGHEPEPGYLSFSRLAYKCGMIYGRLAPSMFKVTIFAFGRKNIES